MTSNPPPDASPRAFDVLAPKLRRPFLAFSAVVLCVGGLSVPRGAQVVLSGTFSWSDPVALELVVNSCAVPTALAAIIAAWRNRIELAAVLILAYFVAAWVPLMFVGGLTMQVDSLMLIGVPMLIAALVVRRAALWIATAALVAAMSVGAYVDTARIDPDGQALSVTNGPSIGTLITATLLFAAMVDWLATLLRDAVVEERRKAGDLDAALEALMDESVARVGLERSLARTRRLDALGRLAGSVAHDFSNVLTGMMGAIRQAEKRVTDEETRDELGVALSLARRAAQLTKSLVSFSVGRSTDILDIEVDRQLEEAQRVYAALMPLGTRIRFDLDAPDALVRCAPHELEQVVLNLVINGADALTELRAQESASVSGSNLIADDGLREITVRTRICRDSDPGDGLGVRRAPASDRTEALASWVVLEVEDRGIGMEADVLRRVFDLEFTTKRRTRAVDTSIDIGRVTLDDVTLGTAIRGGSGLGLSDVAEIVGRRGGGIGASSTPGSGTRFRVWLPQSGSRVAAAVA